ncbi:MAG: hypothetical protein GX316_03335 [Firmicutes bacterium]|nr:hypothetical protein [Bacillota bacterium]
MALFTVLWIVLKQIIRNWRLEAGLLLGLVVAVAVVSAVPIYTNGALQFSLMQDWLKNTARGRLPYTVFMLHDPGMDGDVDIDEYLRLKAFLVENVEKTISAPLVHASRIGTIDTQGIRPVDPDAVQREQYGNLRFMSGLKEKVDVIEGTWPKPQPRADGVVEVIVDEKALDTKELLVGRQYVMRLAKTSEYDRAMKTITAEIVGVFRQKEAYIGSSKWPYFPPFDNSFFISEKLLDHFMTLEGVAIYELVWYWAFDHVDVYVDQLPKLIEELRYLESRANQILPGTRLWMSPANTFSYFREKAFYLRLLMFVLSLPILGMVLYFIVLAAGLTVARRQTEIAMLRSRGASSLQVVFSYFIEWSILGLGAFLIGPRLGLFISKIIGASAGFLSFVDRTALPVRLGKEAYTYAFYAVATAVLACLFPVFGAARHSIVTYKQETVRHKTPFWQRYYLDVILAVFVYIGYRSLQKQALVLETAQSARDSQLLLDPSLFVVPALFLAAAALITLRIYPWLMKGLAWLTDRFAGAALSVTILHLERNPSQYSPLILLIILTVSLGIYGASTARTLDKNYADQIRYEYGSDIVLREQWALPGGGSVGPRGSLAGGVGSAGDEEITIYEPPFYIHKELPGVLAAARVQKLDVNVRSAGQFRGRAHLLAIDPTDFAHTAWMRRDLNQHHFYEYLNLLTTNHEGILASRELVEKYRVRVGDWVTVSLGSQDIDFYVVGMVEYWPSLYPDEQPFFIGNLSYLQDEYMIQPYNVWLKVNETARLADIVDSLREQGIWVIGIDDVRSMLIAGRQEPQRMGLFGMLSTGFVVSVVISLMGFFFYTFLSLTQRYLQFGILRAIGLSVGQLVAMLFIEQVLSVGAAVAVGTLLGGLASKLFLPFTKVSADLTGSVPEFQVIIAASDLYKIYLTLGSMLLIGLIGLVVILSRMRLHQAVKLGEEV